VTRAGELMQAEKLIVAGAGEPLFNGVYAVDDAARAEGWNRAYRKVNGQQTIHHMKGKEWRLRTNYADTQYLVRSSACPPPATGWQASKGLSPAPTVTSEAAAGEDGGDARRAFVETSLRELTWPTIAELEAGMTMHRGMTIQWHDGELSPSIMLAELREIHACTSPVLRCEYEKAFATKYLSWEDPTVGWDAEAAVASKGGKKKGKSSSSGSSFRSKKKHSPLLDDSDDMAEMLSPRNGRVDLQLFCPGGAAVATVAGAATRRTPRASGTAPGLAGLGAAIVLRRLLTLPSPLGRAAAFTAVGLVGAWLLPPSWLSDRVGELKKKIGTCRVNAV